MSPSPVIVVGSVNTDLVVKAERLPRPGETVLGGEFFRALGGKGANQAVAAARLGRLPTTFVAAVGNDTLGVEALGQLRGENLNCEYVRVCEDQPTGVALINVDADGENCISVASGANTQLSPEDVLAVESRSFQNARVLLTCLETPLETVVAALRRGREFGLTTILNPAPAFPEIASPEVLEWVDILTPNENEAEILTGIKITNLDDACRAAKPLQTAGCRSVVFTRGSQGMFVVDETEAFAQRAYEVTAVDTTAAGDAFNGALAIALSESQSLSDACRWAAAAGALCVTCLGAQPSLPTRGDIEAFLV